jgi:gliding motility-associated-like protein
MLKKPFLLLLFLCIGVKAFSAVFVVTSNADSGPGTLRDALTQAAANASTSLNYIEFNITDESEAGRTISILSQLPNISSNLVIDGTTQPGPAFGVSNAKIIIQPASSSSGFDAFTLTNVNNFQFYGIYVRDFNQLVGNHLTTAFFVATSTNIQIGAPGKGNVFANEGYIIENASSSFEVSGLKFYSNFCGFEPDGKTNRPETYQGNVFIDLTNCEGDIEIGDDDVADRNFFGYANYNIRQYGNGPTTAYNATINVKNNYFDFDVNGNPVVNTLSTIGNGDIYMFSFLNNPQYIEYIDYPYTYNFINNKVQNPLKIWMYEVKGDITFQGNQILPGVNKNLGEVRLIMPTQGKLQFGGDAPGEANTIYNEQLIVFGEQRTVLLQNSIYCAPTSQWNDGTWIYRPADDLIAAKLPVINIASVSSSNITGTATPGSEVQLFLDDDCTQCEPQTYFATVYTDKTGNWSYSGLITKGVIASATLNGFTSLFTETGVLNTSNVVQSACGNNGSITNLNLTNSGGYQITDQNNNLISSNKDATNLAPGIYTITTGNSTCASKFLVQIFDATPQIDSDYVQITQPSCGQSNGTIQNLFLSSSNNQILQNDYSAYTYKWLDAGGKIVGTGMDAGNLAVGVYHLEVSYKGNCSTTYGPVTLKNATGPNIDQSNVKVQSTNCGQSTGSITNIPATGTGTLKYSWVNNSTQQTVSTDSILVNQPAGTYKLQVTDDTQCGPVYSSTINIPETNGITMDESNAVTSPASCGNNNGTVKGIIITGATQYQWVNGNNVTVGTSIDLLNVAAGTYTLIASNTSGCSKTSKPYTVNQQTATQFPDYAARITTACYTGTNGSIIVAVDNLVNAVRWVDSTGSTVGTSATLTQASPGTYQLYLTDQNGCEVFYKSYIVPSYPPFIIANYGTPSADECGLNNGSVSVTTMSGGTSVYTYKWTDLNGNQLSTNNTINNLSPGDYYLFITDAGGCGSVRITYTIPSSTESLPAPSVSDVQLCSSGSGLIAVNNASASNTYRLYNSPTASQPIDEQIGGRFTINVTANSTYYLSEVNGSCESNRTQVNVTVGISSVNIANTFTPNGDNINDYWQIAGIENYPDALVQVFNRYGQKLFESKGYSIPFDGTYKGQKLASGVYYYIINLNTKCNLLSGSLTILR